MAAIVPFIPSIIAGGGALAQASATKSAGQIKQIEAKTAAANEELGAIQREADRKGRLVEAIASQRAKGGASGISIFEGSPLAVINEDIRREQVATERDQFQTKLGILTQLARGRIAARSARGLASTGLLTDAANIAGTLPAAKGGNGGGFVGDINIDPTAARTA